MRQKHRYSNNSKGKYESPLSLNIHNISQAQRQEVPVTSYSSSQRHTRTQLDAAAARMRLT